MITDIPEQAYRLGTARSEYRVNWGRFFLTSGLFVLCFIIFVTLSFLAGSYIISILSMFLLLSAAYYLIKLILHHNLRVVVFPGGLAYMRLNRTKILRWEDASILWEQIKEHHLNFIPLYSDFRYTIETRQGEKLILDHTIKGIEDLGLTLKKRIGEILIPRTVESLKAGQTVQFGDLSLNNKGLTFKDQSLSWNELKDIQVVEGQIQIHSTRKRWFPWASLKYAVIPNAFIFIHLMKRFVDTG